MGRGALHSWLYLFGAIALLTASWMNDRPVLFVSGIVLIVGAGIINVMMAIETERRTELRKMLEIVASKVEGRTDG